VILLAIITKITTQKKRTDRYNIFIDDGKGEQYAFSVDEEVLIKFDLKKGKEIDEFDRANIQDQDEIQKAFTMAIHFLSYRMRSEAEIRLSLKKKEIEEPIIQEAIHKLYHYNYLNDLEFAKAFVRTHVNAGNKGPVTIELELKGKGVQETLIEQAMLVYPFDLQVHHAQLLAEKEIKKDRNLSERALLQKLEQTLIRKGFTRSVISAAIAEISLEKDDEEEWNSLCNQAEKAQRRYKNYSGYEYKQRMKQALFQKGFSIELIDRFLANEES
jgi:regulatory protein